MASYCRYHNVNQNFYVRSVFYRRHRVAAHERPIPGHSIHRWQPERLVARLSTYAPLKPAWHSRPRLWSTGLRSAGRHARDASDNRTFDQPKEKKRSRSRNVQFRLYEVIHRGFQVPVEACCNSAIVSAKRDGYFGLRQSLAGVFDKPESSCVLVPVSRTLHFRNVDLRHFQHRLGSTSRAIRVWVKKELSQTSRHDLPGQSPTVFESDSRNCNQVLNSSRCRSIRDFSFPECCLLVGQNVPIAAGCRCDSPSCSFD